MPRATPLHTYTGTRRIRCGMYQEARLENIHIWEMSILRPRVVCPSVQHGRQGGCTRYAGRTCHGLRGTSGPGTEDPFSMDVDESPVCMRRGTCREATCMLATEDWPRAISVETMAEYLPAEESSGWPRSFRPSDMRTCGRICPAETEQVCQAHRNCCAQRSLGGSSPLVFVRMNLAYQVGGVARPVRYVLWNLYGALAESVAPAARHP